MLSELHDQAPVHPPAATRAAIEAALGAPPEALFHNFEDMPLASGSVAQVWPHMSGTTRSWLGTAMSGAEAGGGPCALVKVPPWSRHNFP